MAEANDVALELEKLRGTCTAGFAEVKGSLSVLVERSDRTEEITRDHASRIAALERRVWAAAGGAAALATAASYFVRVTSGQ
jgi:hypothetical protein